jgi:predicted regulator of Ras-like GTPase activity (Roadblock/LC7/MglB family)
MFQLNIRRHWYLGILFAVITIISLVILPNQSPDRVFTTSVLLLIALELLLSWMLSELCYIKSNPTQLLVITLTLLGLVMTFGAVGNACSSVTEALPGTNCVVSLVQLVIMNLGGLACTIAIFQLVPLPEEPENLGQRLRERLRATTGEQATAKIVHAEGFTISGPAPSFFEGSETNSATENNPDIGTNETAIADQIKEASNDTVRSGGPKPSEATATLSPEEVVAKSSEVKSATAEALSKAQALLGAAKRPNPANAFLSQSTSLKGALGRADSEPTASPSSAERPPFLVEQSPGKDLQGFQPPVRSDDQRREFSADETVTELPTLTAADLKKMAFGLPEDAVEIKLGGIEPEIPSVEALDAIASPGHGSESGRGKGQSGIAGILRKEPAKSVTSSKFLRQNAGATLDGGANADALPKELALSAQLELSEQQQPVSRAEEIIAALKTTEQSAEITSGQDDTPNNLFVGGVDEEVDSLFSTIAPPEVQQDFDPTRFNQQVPEVKVAANDEARRAREQADAAEVENLFGQKVDDHVDEIFAALASKEAQREFDPRALEGSRDLQEAVPTLPLEPVQQASAQPPSHAPNNLFGQSVDESVDDIFSAMVPEEAQKEVTESRYAKVPEKPAQEKGLFGTEVDEEIDDIFSQLAPPEAQRNLSDTRNLLSDVNPFSQNREIARAANSAKHSGSDPPVAKATETAAASGDQDDAVDDDDFEGAVVNPVTKNLEVREFGRLSAPTPTAGNQSTVGTMKTIGKLLLDVSVIENIIKSGETADGPAFNNARVISVARGEGIKALLGKIDAYEGVVGSLIVGHDGLIIASTVTPQLLLDKEALGVLSTALLDTSNLATLKLEVGKLRQMVLLSKPRGPERIPLTTVLTDVEVGILAVFLDAQELAKLDGLLESIHKTVHG